MDGNKHGCPLLIAGLVLERMLLPLTIRGKRKTFEMKTDLGLQGLSALSGIKMSRSLIPSPIVPAERLYSMTASVLPQPDI